MAKKVYCGKCRWYDGGSWEYPADDCMKIVGYTSDYECEKIASRTDGQPSELNANNDCAYYSWYWFGFRGY